MKILHIYKDYYPVLGGIENHVKVLAEAQVAAGHEVIVSVCNQGFASIEEVSNGVRIIKSGRLTTAASMPLSLRQLLTIRRIRADIVHVQSPFPLGEVGAWWLQSKTPLVLSYQSDVVRQKNILRLYGPLLKRVLQRADCILVNSPRYIASSPWLLPVKEKCQVVPIGVDATRFRPPAKPYADPPKLLFLGRLRYYKGLDTLIAAMTELPAEVTLDIAGTGPLYETLAAQVARLNLQSRVRFLHEVSDEALPALYQQASLFVLPSNARSEAYGIVLVEAMASGLPCVSTELGTGTSWLVQEGVTGRVVPPQNPAVMAAAIRDLLADPDSLRAMGRAARMRVETELTQERMVSRVLAVYENLLHA
ncbi:MAG: glycosyltransferase [Anaerolineae bacterium]|nr:glycosyltransferase [Anaerolineae bacterium]